MLASHPGYQCLTAFAPYDADYCFGDVKFGGNAQAITKDRQADGGRGWLAKADALSVLCARSELGLLLCWTSLNPPCPAACRWLHHTSLLWDFQHPRMALLKHPDRQPEYRQVQADLKHASCVQHISAYPEAGCSKGVFLQPAAYPMHSVGCWPAGQGPS